MCDHKVHSTAAEPTFNAVDKDRRRLLAGGLAGITAATLGGLPRGAAADENAGDPYARPEQPALPDGGFELDLQRAALVVTDPQIDFLSPDGVTWEVVGESVREHGTVENIRRLFAAAKQRGMTVAVSPEIPCLEFPAVWPAMFPIRHRARLPQTAGQPFRWA